MTDLSNEVKRGYVFGRDCCSAAMIEIYLICRVQIRELVAFTVDLNSMDNVLMVSTF